MCMAAEDKLHDQKWHLESVRNGLPQVLKEKHFPHCAALGEGFFAFIYAHASETNSLTPIIYLAEQCIAGKSHIPTPTTPQPMEPFEREMAQMSVGGDDSFFNDPPSDDIDLPIPKPSAYPDHLPDDGATEASFSDITGLSSISQRPPMGVHLASTPKKIGESVEITTANPELYIQNMNYKGVLNEYSQQNATSPPEYRTDRVFRPGHPDHLPLFKSVVAMQCNGQDITAVGHGRTKKEAESRAAFVVCNRFFSD
ncbi:hypothetical protein J8273_7729 [Carpediemonas membranifera]|uniref:DRBM domain-containing protein n=2 Tax=Carpediemonas membranifera TaxID=201153 RepID=A0A8J6AYJ0_9EUKA|nr:hypothetical protein J8273_7729 [Carpediemonas membranifera]|eukprot:KAG9390379.1 hypothetical protein J8273_7729 [Carpediemonas membranifera]